MHGQVFFFFYIYIWPNASCPSFSKLFVDKIHCVLSPAKFLMLKCIVQVYKLPDDSQHDHFWRLTHFLMTKSSRVLPPTHFKDKMHCFSSSKLFADKIHHGVMSSWTPQRQRCLVMFLEGQPPSSHIVFMDLLKTKRSIVVRVLSKVIFHLYASVLRHCPLDKFVYWCLDFFFFFFNSIAVLGGECRLQACSAMLWSTQLVCYTMTSTSTEKYNTYTPPSFFLLRVCACFLYVITVEICFPSNFLRITDAHQ